MKNRILTSEKIKEFKEYLIYEEKSKITVDKYIHDVSAFMEYANGLEITKDIVISYKKELVSKYAVRSVNSKLASVNSLLSFLGWEDCKVKSLKLQRETYSSEEKELTIMFCKHCGSQIDNYYTYCLIRRFIKKRGYRFCDNLFLELLIRFERTTSSCI